MLSVLRFTDSDYSFGISVSSKSSYDGVCVAHLFIVLGCVVYLCFVSLRLVSCVPSVASVSGLSNNSLSRRFSLTFI